MNFWNGVALASGLIGTALGVFNAFNGYWRGVRRLKVTCGFTEGGYANPPNVWCEVINPGHLPVFVTAVKMRLLVDGVPKETAIYGDSYVEEGMLVELKPGAALRKPAPARYAPFFLRLTDIVAKSGDGKVVHVSRRSLRRTQAKLRASLEELQRREVEEAAKVRDAARAPGNPPM